MLFILTSLSVSSDGIFNSTSIILGTFVRFVNSFNKFNIIFIFSIDFFNSITHNIIVKRFYKVKFMTIIKDLRLKRGITQRELASLCNVHQTAVSQWEKGRTLPDKNALIKLSDIFGVSIDTLMKKNTPAKPNSIPVLGYVRAGCPAEAIENIIDYEDISPEMAAKGEHFGLRVVGDSMTPRICQGDVVIVRKQNYIENGEIGVVLINNLDATIKKVIKNGTGLTLIPFNNDYEPLVFTAEEIVTLPVTIIGKVVELRGKF